MGGSRIRHVLESAQSSTAVSVSQLHSTSMHRGSHGDEAVDLMNRAHEACPDSRGARGNIDITLTVDGSAAAREAA